MASKTFGERLADRVAAMGGSWSPPTPAHKQRIDVSRCDCRRARTIVLEEAFVLIYTL